jgi:predicted TIM-barrel fold metal-dependent hydrolase
MAASPQRIDIHHHLFPPAFLAAMDAKGVKEAGDVAVPAWSAEKSIEIMDTYGISTAIVSLSAPGVTFCERGEARDLARACNEFAAEMITRHPGRFGSFAALPMPHTENACREAVHALDVLHADGIGLLGSSQGKFLGDPQFDELMAELDRREAVVFVHPNMHKTSTELGLTAPGFAIEFLCDTTRAAVNLILTGTTEKYPNIRWILAHAGGFLPYVAWRLSLTNDMPQYAIKAPHGMLHHVRRYYYDTALSPSPYAMAALRELVEPSQIVFGCDYPFATKVVIGMQAEALEKLTIFDEATKSGINRTHALELFPRLASAALGDDEASFAARARRALARPAVAIAERLRNR